MTHELPPWIRPKIPKTLEVNQDNIPDELKRSPRWVVWKAVLKENGKITKPPYQARHPGLQASTKNPHHLADFNTAYNAYVGNDDVSGIGYVADPADGLVFMDLDGCVRDGELDDAAQAAVNSFLSYTEASPSGTGVRIIAKGGIPHDFTNSTIGREMYAGHSVRYLTITGQVLEELTTIQDAQEAISHYFEQWKTKTRDTTQAAATTATEAAESVDLSRLNDFTRNVIDGDYSSYEAERDSGRSEALLGVCKDMLRAKYSDAEILRVTTHPDYAISAAALDRRKGDMQSAAQWVATYTLPEAKRKIAEEDAPQIHIKLNGEDREPRTDQETDHAPATVELGKIPGALGSFVDWYEKTAITAQPELAIQAALALGSLVAGRQYQTARIPNYANLWFLNVAKSGAGKEHARWCIDKVLTAADCSELLNNGYTSKGAVFSMLAVHPRHISIIDELGRYLEAAMQDRGNTHFKDGITALMESWNRSDGVMKPPQYSDRGLSEQARKDLKQPVTRPSITLLGMTTPSTLYAAITRDAVRDGFLSRFILCESEIEGADELRMMTELTPPESLVRWVRAASAPKQAGNLADVDIAYSAPPPHIVPIDADAWEIFQASKREEGKIRRLAEADELGELANRITQKAIRVALILAVSVNHKQPNITMELADWAVKYVTRMDKGMIEIAAKQVSEGRLARLNQKILDYIKRGSIRGRTEREVRRAYGAYGNDFAVAIRHLVDAELITKAEIEHENGRGRKRIAYVHEAHFRGLNTSVKISDVN